jgi:hypothetical protein
MTDFEWSRPGMAVRTGAELQAARKAAAERYAQVAAKHTPRDVVVTYRKGLSGRAWVKSRKISDLSARSCPCGSQPHQQEAPAP